MRRWSEKKLTSAQNTFSRPNFDVFVLSFDCPCGSLWIYLAVILIFIIGYMHSHCVIRSELESNVFFLWLCVKVVRWPVVWGHSWFETVSLEWKQKSLRNIMTVWQSVYAQCNKDICFIFSASHLYKLKIGPDDWFVTRSLFKLGLFCVFISLNDIGAGEGKKTL